MEPARPAGRPERGVRRRLRLLIGLRILELASPPGAASTALAAPPDPRRALPSIRRLAEIAGCHRNTAAAAYRDLQRCGLVRTIRGAGTFPAGPRRLPASPPIFGCIATDLRTVLAADIGRPVGPSVSESSRYLLARAPLLLPLDETPPTGRRLLIPVAPLGLSLTALRRLRPGEEVVLLSESPRLGRLVRNVIGALHGADGGLQRVEDPVAACRQPAPLRLVDARQAPCVGTTRPPAGFIKLSLVVGTGPRTG